MIDRIVEGLQKKVFIWPSPLPAIFPRKEEETRMTDTLNAWMHNPDLRTLMQDLFLDSVKKTFRNSKLSQLDRYFCNPHTKKPTEEHRNEIFTLAANTCWQILLEMPDSVARTVKETQDDLAEGILSPHDVAQRISKAVVQVLYSKVSDAARDQSFALLRQAIERKKIDGKPVFQTFHEKAPRNNTFFAPAATPTSIPKNLPSSTIPQHLTAVDPKIRKYGSNRNSLWDTDVVANEACRFWEAYVHEFYADTPGLVPLYGFYCWIRKTISLPSQKNNDESDAVPLDTMLADDKLDPENVALFHEDLLLAKKQAKAFVKNLRPRDCQLIVLLAEPNATLESTAKALGLKGASSIARQKKALVLRIQELAMQWSDTQCMELFVATIHEECKKRRIGSDRDVTSQTRS